jgi:hypothetical protein
LVAMPEVNHDKKKAGWTGHCPTQPTGYRDCAGS